MPDTPVIYESLAQWFEPDPSNKKHDIGELSSDDKATADTYKVVFIDRKVVFDLDDLLRYGTLQKVPPPPLPDSGSGAKTDLSSGPFVKPVKPVIAEG